MRLSVPVVAVLAGVLTLVVALPATQVSRAQTAPRNVTILAGVGNIQAAEALWRAKINPMRASSSLAPGEVSALAAAIAASIRDTLLREDAPEITYVEEPGLIHVYPVLPWIPESGRAWDRTIDFLQG